MKASHTAMAAAILACGAPALAFDKPATTYKVFQFPQDRIPRIDGDFSDWDIVPESYVVSQDQMTDQDGGHRNPDKTLNIRVKVGWVKGLNRLYFLYEADDDYWDFSLPGLHNDTFEVVVDADLTGTPLIDIGHQDIWTPEWVGQRASRQDPRVPTDLAHWYNHGVQAQNYHIMTPHLNKDWAMAWGSPTWIKDFPYANSAQRYEFKPGQRGKYRLEFYITPFDYAGPEGPERAVESKLRENAPIALGWIVIDYDDVATDKKNGFWSLSSQRPMFGLASDLPLFRLMPVEPGLLPRIEARWSWKVVDMGQPPGRVPRRQRGPRDGVALGFRRRAELERAAPDPPVREARQFRDHPRRGRPDGKSRRSKVWDVQLR